MASHGERRPVRKLTTDAGRSKPTLRARRPRRPAAVPGSVALIADFTDPWSERIRACLPPATSLVKVDALKRIPDPSLWPAEATTAEAIVIHSPGSATADLKLLAEARTRWPGRLYLCTGDGLRLRSWTLIHTKIDRILDEATAPEILPGLLADDEARAAHLDPRRPRARVGVVSHQATMKTHLEAMCREIGYETSDTFADVLLCDIAYHDPTGLRRLRALSETRVVAAILGLPDRGSVRAAEESGSSACLNVMCEPLDLAYVLRKLENSARADSSMRL